MILVFTLIFFGLLRLDFLFSIFYFLFNVLLYWRRTSCL